MKNKSISLISIILAVIMLSIIIYIYISNRIDMKYVPNYELEDFMEYPVKKLGVNEYTVANVDDEAMAKLYFNIYTNMLFEDINKAYSKLEDKSKFSNIDEFTQYIGIITEDFLSIPEFYSYNVRNSKNNASVTYRIIDKKGYEYTFEAKAVMKYTVDIERNSNFS